MQLCAVFNRCSALRALLTLVGVFVLAGCASVSPYAHLDARPGRNLRSHVAFLCEPELKGRAPRTSGSRLARNYIASQYQACGLVPWGTAQSYELSFRFGRNLIGVLPGTDPALSKEVVLVCAHYDHLGKNGTGKVHPGASDNAAGVAVLLETARQLATPGLRPKRSVAFAAFDCEEMMLLGSFAFSSRQDVRDAKIFAVVNSDILGRDFMDVVPHSLFVSGTESYPELRRSVRESATAAGLRVLPLGTDLIGPRSDHVAFEARDVPCLFFSSGTCKDYHQPGDTPDKLNYGDLESTAKVILDAVQDLANRANPPAKDSSTDCDIEELQTVKTVMSEVNANLEAACVKKEDAEAFANLAAKAEALLQSGQYNPETRASLVSDAAGILAPYFLPAGPGGNALTGPQQKDLALGLRCLQQFYATHRHELLEGYRKLVVQILEHRPGPFRAMPLFHYEVYFLDPQDISLSENDSGKCSLHAMVNWLNLWAGSRHTWWLIKPFGASMSLGLDTIDCTGTRQQLADFCLLRLHRQQTNEMNLATTRKLLQTITGATPRESYQELITQRLNTGGFKDKTDWIVSCIFSDSPELALRGLAADASDPRIRDAACKVILNRNIRGDVRAAAIETAAKAAKTPDKTVLLAFCDVLDDSTPSSQREHVPQLRKDYPFSDRALLQSVRPFFEKQLQQSANRTIGALARAQLMKAAKKDLGPDPVRWRKWCQSR